MNDFGIRLEGLQGVIKDLVFYKKGTSPATRTFQIRTGPGCEPSGEVTMRRQVEGFLVKWPNNLETVSSYDFEYILGPRGKKIYPIEPPEIELDIAPEPVVERKSKPKGRDAWAERVGAE
jgi:hypothetical protein